MKINCTFLMFALIASVILCRVTADSKVATDNSKIPVLPETSGSNDKEKVAVDPKASGSDKNDSSERLEHKAGRNKQKTDNDQKDEQQKEHKGLDMKHKKESKEGRLPPVREKCDSLSNSCMDDDKSLVACLRVPGNESPALSLLIQNKGKGSLGITISAPHLVELEKNQIELQENKDTEVKVSISGLGNDHFIVLTAGHGNCSLNLTDQYLALKKVDHSSDSYFGIFKLTLSTGFLVLAVLLTVVVSVFKYTKVRRRHFAGKGPKYQKLDMELPVSRGSKLEGGEHEGWDNSWGDSWDDEEAPQAPSLPVTPSLSSKGLGFKEA